MCNYFYLLKGTLYRSPNNPEDLIEVHEVFENDNLIVARERAFEVYQNYVDVLMESHQETYTTHDNANRVLHSFLEKEEDLEDLLNNPRTMKYPQPDTVHDFDKGISIFLVRTDSKTFQTLEGELIYEDKYLIHDLNSELPAVLEHLYDNLVKEYELYQKYGYDCKGFTATIPKAPSISSSDEIFILQTPIVYTL